MKSKVPNISPIEKAISKLDSIAKEDDEYETFGKHVSNQMTIIPLERALILQNDIQGLLPRERYIAYQIHKQFQDLQPRV